MSQQVVVVVSSNFPSFPSATIDPMEESKGSGFTRDGTVDLRGRPVLASQTGRWRACVFLLGYEAFERMAFYGIAMNLVVYMTTQLHENTVASVRSVNNWTGSVWMTPIIGAYIADAYAGRFWTFTVSALIYVSGMTMLTLAVSLKSLRPTCTDGVCNKANPSQLAFFFTSLYTIALGAGGTKPNISTFGADQFDDFDPIEKKLKTSFFNWWMFSSFFGALIASLCLIYIQENLGWGLGYTIPTMGLVASLIIFYIGMPYYRHKTKKTDENPMWEMIKVWKKAFANRGAKLPSDASGLYEQDSQHYALSAKRRLQHTSGFRFLDKAATIVEGASSKPSSITQVEEAKLILGMALVWLTTLIPSTALAQVNTLFVKQGTTLRRTLFGHFQIPSASLTSSITITMLLFLPLYDRLFVPFARRRTGNPRGISLLQRLGIGLAIQTLVIGVAGIMEAKRMHVIKANGIAGATQIVPMSILWLLPQYMLMGIGDVFSTIGVLEFFYDQSPNHMQSLGTTFFTTGIGMGNFLNGLLVTVVDKASRSRGGKSWIGDNLNDSHLDYYYALLMAMSAANMGVFLWVSRGYHYKEEAVAGDGMEMELAGHDRREDPNQ